VKSEKAAAGPESPTSGGSGIRQPLKALAIPFSHPLCGIHVLCKLGIVFGPFLEFHPKRAVPVRAKFFFFFH
jgi:hypothetical protein